MHGVGLFCNLFCSRLWFEFCVRYIPFDFHHICGNVHFERLSALYEDIREDLGKQGYVAQTLFTGLCLLFPFLGTSSQQGLEAFVIQEEQSSMGNLLTCAFCSICSLNSNHHDEESWKGLKIISQRSLSGVLRT